MIYRVTIDECFNNESDAKDVYDKALDRLPDSHTINPDAPDEERGHILLQKCFHNQTPRLECETLEEEYGPD